VVPVGGELLGRQLPVALQLPLVDAADHDRALAVVIEHGIHVPGHVTEERAESDRFGVPGAEDQPVVAVDVRDLDQTPLAGGEGLGVANLVGDADQVAFQVVGPAVVGAGEVAGGADVGAAHPGSAVPAGVEEGADPAVLVHSDDHRILTHVGGEEVARPLELVGVSQEQPARGEDPSQLLPVDRRLGEDRPVQQAAFGVDQPADVHVPAHLRRAPQGAARCRRGGFG
jgi:hypothetical protein